MTGAYVPYEDVPKYVEKLTGKKVLITSTKFRYLRVEYENFVIQVKITPIQIEQQPTDSSPLPFINYEDLVHIVDWVQLCSGPSQLGGSMMLGPGGPMGIIR